MNAVNHFLARSIAVSAVANPIVGVPAAWASHFVLDSVPHFGYKAPGYGHAFRDNPRRTALYLASNAVMFLIAVFVLPLWSMGWLALLGGFVAISPDFMRPIRYFLYERYDKEPQGGVITKFHTKIQWCERPWGTFVEIAFFALLMIIATNNMI